MVKDSAFLFHDVFDSLNFFDASDTDAIGCQADGGDSGCSGCSGCGGCGG